MQWKSKYYRMIHNFKHLFLKFYVKVIHVYIIYYIIILDLCFWGVEESGMAMSQLAP